MSKIRVMNELLANKIAAGEVIEKLASIVKELTENSIDAGASKIVIELLNAGMDDIIVTDSVEEAEAFAKETYLKKAAAEKKMYETIKEEEKKAQEEELAAAGAAEDEDYDEDEEL